MGRCPPSCIISCIYRYIYVGYCSGSHGGLPSCIYPAFVLQWWPRYKILIMHLPSLLLHWSPWSRSSILYLFCINMVIVMALHPVSTNRHCTTVVAMVAVPCLPWLPLYIRQNVSSNFCKSAVTHFKCSQVNSSPVIRSSVLVVFVVNIVPL